MSRMKPPAGPVTSAGTALHAFERMNEADALAFNAYQNFQRYTAGTLTSRKHRMAFEAYTELAEAWGKVLRDWLVQQMEAGK
jgi:hypothetical protein